MGAWVHKLLSVDLVNMIGECAGCGNVQLVLKQGKPKCKNGKKQYHKSPPSNWAYRKHVRDKCERCGFVPEAMCQLDVHHIDHNHDNNDPNNLRTLCANCHRLVHFT